MKRCPRCERTYADETLNFCLDDGTVLTADAEAATAILPAAAVFGTAPRAVSVSSFAESSIAVLPFTNISADVENDYFCDGLAEDLLNALSKIEGLKVAARTSSFSFKGRNIDASEIGRALRVNTVLEGSVRKSGSKLRITAQLVNAADGYQIWSERYDRELRDIFDIQDEITLAIVDALKLKLLGEKRVEVLKRYTDNTEAYQLYLRGRFYWNKRTTSGFKQAIEYFERAIALDPNYALAYSGIADCYNSSGFTFDVGALPSKDLVSKAKSAALKALELDDSLAEAHTSLAYEKQLFEWDWAAAESSFRRAIDLNPNYANAHHWYSHFLVAMSRFEESLVQSKLALELDPLSAVMSAHLGWHHLYSREYDASINQFKAAMCLDPEFLHAHWYLALAYEQRALYAEAEAEFSETMAAGEDNPTIKADAAHFFAVSGDQKKARHLLAEITRESPYTNPPSFGIALVHLGLGDKTHAFEYLEKAFQERSDLLIYLKVEPRLDPLRGDPRYDDLVKRIGLPD